MAWRNKKKYNIFKYYAKVAKILFRISKRNLHTVYKKTIKIKRNKRNIVFI